MLDLTVINYIISAEVLRPEDNLDSRLIEAIRSFIICSPYSVYNPSALYIVSKCPGLPPAYLKRFPKRFNTITVVGEDGYLEYRRRNDRRSFIVRGRNGKEVTVNNR